MAKFNLKTEWVSTDAWRGYEKPIYAAGGANDTGTWEDSPCNSHEAEKELKQFRTLLRKENIPFRNKTCQSSNVFCVHRYVVVQPEDLDKAKQIAKKLQEATRLFYAV